MVRAHESDTAQDRSPMRQLPSLLTLCILCTTVVAAGCVGGGSTDPAGAGDGTTGSDGDGDGDGDLPAPEPMAGGELLLEDCGYAVTTPNEATAPRVATAGLGPDGTPRQVHLGFGGSPATTMAITWRTADDETEVSTVQFARGADLSAAELDQTKDGFTFMYTSGFGRAGDPVRIHEAHLCNLEPDTEYSYRVGGGTDAAGADVWSPVYTFRTAPETGDASASVKVLALGDSRDGYDVWHNLLVEAEKRGLPDLILFTGDAVTIGNIQVEWEQFFDEGEFMLARVPMVSAHGNHEFNSVNFAAQFAHPVKADGVETSFAFDYGPLRIVVANDTPVESDEIDGAQRDFIDASFTEGAAQPWKILMHHRSLYSSAENHGSDLGLRRSWSPLIDEHQVDFDLSGHDHNYERSKPLSGGEVAEVGTTYIVSGGAGAPLYGAGSEFWTAASASTHNLVLLTFNGNVSVDAEALTDSGAVIDSFAIAKP